MSAQNESKDSKTDTLLHAGMLNPSPEKVHDPKFREDEFFDPRDVVQVKYEMLRRVRIEKASVTQAVEEYGVSRPTHDQARASFHATGLGGLVPQKRGPHGPHKLQGEVLAFLKRQVAPGQGTSVPEPQRSLPRSSVPDQHRAVVRIFATMAMVPANKEKR